MKNNLNFKIVFFIVNIVAYNFKKYIIYVKLKKI